MKLSTIAFLLASLLAFLLGLFALENVAAGLERNESTTVIAAFDFVDMMSMLRTEDTFEAGKYPKRHCIPRRANLQLLRTRCCPPQPAIMQLIAASKVKLETASTDKKDTIPLWPVHQHLVTTHCSLLLCDSKRTPKASPSQKGAGFELVVSPTTMNPHFNHSS
ncbi:putative exopolygalacturonase B [Fusarium oxysporum f. sp. albedinis]|nr:putative exopolygalacturonase B [Fusarium oxysporum f. sp. albedinis]